MKRINNILTALLLLICSSIYGQMDSYNFKRELTGVNEQWHQITLPKEIFDKVSPSLSDIRIFGITANKDTLEAPYIVRLNKEKSLVEDIEFSLVNVSYNQKGSYFTFGISELETINQINLDFEERNFDWKINLEGSQNQQEWFTVLENYRILSIENEITEFEFTKLTFPNTKYKFYRLQIPTQEKPKLISAKIVRKTVTKGESQTYTFAKKTKVDKSKKRTIIHLDLKLPVPVNSIKISVKDSLEFYRPITIKHLVDSVKTEQGWKYNYRTLSSGTLNSLEENDFRIKGNIFQKLKIIIQNQDNQPLDIGLIEIKGYVHKLFVRFDKPASYFLVYGNNKVGKPMYDIAHFEDKIPKSAKPLQLGKEQCISHQKVSKTQALFENKIWLWGIMLLIIIALGWFSLKMMKPKNN